MYASDELRFDYNIILIAVRDCNYAIRYALIKQDQKDYILNVAQSKLAICGYIAPVLNVTDEGEILMLSGKILLTKIPLNITWDKLAKLVIDMNQNEINCDYLYFTRNNIPIEPWDYDKIII